LIESGFEEEKPSGQSESRLHRKKSTNKFMKKFGRLTKKQENLIGWPHST